MMINIPQEWLEFRSVHTLKEKSGGLQVIVVPLLLFCDDTSGNTSKKWNKFIEWNMTVAGEVYSS